jgi:hypothetical protein
MGTKVDSAQAEDISVMRMHFECGWLEQLSAGDNKPVTEAAEYHIVLGAELAADLGLERVELSEEVADASTRMLKRIRDFGVTEKMLLRCR